MAALARLSGRTSAAAPRSSGGDSTKQAAHLLHPAVAGEGEGDAAGAREAAAAVAVAVAEDAGAGADGAGSPAEAGGGARRQSNNNRFGDDDLRGGGSRRTPSNATSSLAEGKTGRSVAADVVGARDSLRLRGGSGGVGGVGGGGGRSPLSASLRSRRSWFVVGRRTA